jgi:hypothetical protein
MEEDVAGLQRAAGHDYATCTECGAVFDRRRARDVPAGITDESRSEFAELCPECHRRALEGEVPAPPAGHEGA